MPNGRLSNGGDSPPNSTFGGLKHRRVAPYEGGLTKIRMREALAREAALLRRVDALIQEQQKGLSKLVAWGYYPSGGLGLGLILVVVIILLLLGRI